MFDSCWAPCYQKHFCAVGRTDSETLTNRSGSQGRSFSTMSCAHPWVLPSFWNFWGFDAGPSVSTPPTSFMLISSTIIGVFQQFTWEEKEKTAALPYSRLRVVLSDRNSQTRKGTIVWFANLGWRLESCQTFHLERVALVLRYLRKHDFYDAFSISFLGLRKNP